MFSYTNFQESPLLTILCRCGRQFIQEEIYTCLGCCNYACRYCTSIELHTYYCRNCSLVHSENESSKASTCNTCYSCPKCSHTLSIFKDSKNKKNILLCQFCYWTTKELGIEEDTAEELQAAVAKASKGLREPDLRLYQSCQRFFKEKIIENGEVRKELSRKPRTANDTKNMVMQFRADYLGLQASQAGSSILAPVHLSSDPELTFTTLDDEDEAEEDRGARNLPKGLPLLARKTRRCLHCKKLLTKSFKTFKNEHKVELGHNEPKVLICQKSPFVDRVKVKAVVQCVYKPSPEGSVEVKGGEVFEVGQDKFVGSGSQERLVHRFSLLVQIAIPNKEKKTIEYKFMLEI